MKPEIFETMVTRNGWQEYTGRYRTRVYNGDQMIAFELPGHGGKDTRQAARRIHALWINGKSASEIVSETGCEIAN